MRPVQWPWALVRQPPQRVTASAHERHAARHNIIYSTHDVDNIEKTVTTMARGRRFTSNPVIAQRGCFMTGFIHSTFKFYWCVRHVTVIDSSEDVYGPYSRLTNPYAREIPGFD